MNYKLGVIGSSAFKDYKRFEEILSGLKSQPWEIVSGNCKGTEALAENYAMRRGISLERFEYASGVKGGRFLLNKQIVDNSDALIVFWDSVSTSAIQAINLATFKKMVVKVIPVAEADRDVKAKNDIGFQGNRRWLSNMWPCSVKVGDVTFSSSEGAYQAFKVRKHRNLVEKLARMPAITTKTEVRKWKAYFSNFDRVAAMEHIVRSKFKQNSYLAKKLVLTGDEELIEENTWNDTFFGVCDGVGENHLGKILMKVRGELND